MALALSLVLTQDLFIKVQITYHYHGHSEIIFKYFLLILSFPESPESFGLLRKEGMDGLTDDIRTSHSICFIGILACVEEGHPHGAQIYLEDVHLASSVNNLQELV